MTPTNGQGKKSSNTLCIGRGKDCKAETRREKSGVHRIMNSISCGAAGSLSNANGTG